MPQVGPWRCQLCCYVAAIHFTAPVSAAAAGADRHRRGRLLRQAPRPQAARASASGRTAAGADPEALQRAALLLQLGRLHAAGRYGGLQQLHARRLHLHLLRLGGKVNVWIRVMVGFGLGQASRSSLLNLHLLRLGRA